MMNDPTNRAMMANTIKKTLKKLMSSLIAAWSSLVISVPVSTSVPFGTTFEMLLDELSLTDTRIGDDLDRVDLAGLRQVEPARPSV